MAHAPAITVADALRLQRGIHETLIESGTYIDPINRPRALYLAGRIDIDEFERRAGEALGLPLDPDQDPPAALI